MDNELLQKCENELYAAQRVAETDDADIVSGVLAHRLVLARQELNEAAARIMALEHELGLAIERGRQSGIIKAADESGLLDALAEHTRWPGRNSR